MNKNDYAGVPYDESYAPKYNDIWIHSDSWSPEARHHIQTLKELVKPGTRWLDAGCGTGYFLSQFPGIQRAGFDLSEAMLAEARKANPDALFFQKADLKEEVKAWNNQWDLLTCTGQPWVYLKTIDEIGEMVGHFAGYLKDDGQCLIPFYDLTDFTRHDLPEFNYETDIPDNIPFQTGFVWSIVENGVAHGQMLLPSVDQWLRWFNLYFKQVDILRWPHDPPQLRVPRRIFLCSGKRTEGDTTPIRIVRHPVPALPGGQPPPNTNGQSVYPRLTDRPLSYFIARFKPWKPWFWKKAFRVVKRKW